MVGGIEFHHIIIMVEKHLHLQTSKVWLILEVWVFWTKAKIKKIKGFNMEFPFYFSFLFFSFQTKK